MKEIKIRDYPGLKSIPRKITEMGFTGVIWAVWAYLLLPVINLIMWILGLSFIHISVVEQVGYIEFIGLMSRMGWIVLTVFLVLRLWGYYNYYRFGKRSRRKSNISLTTAEMAASFNISESKILKMQQDNEVYFPSFEDNDTETTMIKKGKRNS
jgi:poly-beta-1,6-N-acetyl-D-glucosamine biosynthesis protein PgaD